MAQNPPRASDSGAQSGTYALVDSPVRPLAIPGRSVGAEVFSAPRPRTVGDLHRSSGSVVYGTRSVVERSIRDTFAIAKCQRVRVADRLGLRADAGGVLAGKKPQNPSF
jgi:hypothetical protein